MVDIPREMHEDPEARAAWNAATEQERLRSVTSIADLVEQDRADPNTPDDFDIDLTYFDERVTGRDPNEPQAFMVGQTWNVAAMRKVADLLIKWGWHVAESPGWETRGVGTLRANTIGCHHTGAEVDIDRILRDGRTDLKGPLCNFALHLDGTIVLMAAGTANHFGVATIPNSQAWGIECTGPVPISSQGPQAFPNYKAYTALCVAIRTVEGWGVGTIKGHKEVALPDGRKPDPAFGDGFPKPYPDMDRFRAACNVSKVLKNETPVEDDMQADEVRAILGLKPGQNMQLAVFGQGDNSQVFNRMVATNNAGSVAAMVGGLVTSVAALTQMVADMKTDLTDDEAKIVADAKANKDAVLEALKATSVPPVTGA